MVAIVKRNFSQSVPKREVGSGKQQQRVKPGESQAANGRKLGQALNQFRWWREASTRK